ncbi:hypothetical protein HD554DRAFT_2314003 [Boletus coccyginus]|nr:hypothetical protein HD554DRAFT_2314003 [Boletus coccyginus]
MIHDCTDWTTTPPTRKTPLLILTRGDERVYTSVPKEFKTLEQVARREFDLGDVGIHFSSSCVNLCDGLPARITENAWEHISPYIGCATVQVSGPRAVEDQPPRDVPRNDQSDNDEAGPHAGAKRKLPLDMDDGNDDEQSDHGPGDRLSASAREAVRGEKDAPSDREDDHDDASAPEGQHEDEEVNAIPPRKLRRVVSENEDEGDESERAKSQASPAASPPKSEKEIKKERLGDYRPQPDSQPAEPPHQPDKPIKQEKQQNANGSQHPHTESEFETQPRARTESRESHKVMIRVAHRPSKQESKFTTKSTTKVTKVLAGACKSFGLDASR